MTESALDELQDLALVVGQVAQLLLIGLAAVQQSPPSAESVVRAGVAEPRVVDVGSQPVCPAGAPGCHAARDRRRRRSRRRSAACGRGLAQHTHQIDHRLVDARLTRKRSAEPLTASRIASRLRRSRSARAPLLAGPGVREDDRELAGDVDEHRMSCLPHVRDASAVEPEDAGQLAVAKSGTSTKEATSRSTSRSRIGSSQASFATSSTTIGPCFEALARSRPTTRPRSRTPACPRRSCSGSRSRPRHGARHS